MKPEIEKSVRLTTREGEERSRGALGVASVAGKPSVHWQIEYRNANTRNRWLPFCSIHEQSELYRARCQAKTKAGADGSVRVFCIRKQLIEDDSLELHHAGKNPFAYAAVIGKEQESQ